MNWRKWLRSRDHYQRLGYVHGGIEEFYKYLEQHGGVDEADKETWRVEEHDGYTTFTWGTFPNDYMWHVFHAPLHDE